MASEEPDYDLVNPGVREVVRRLRAAGFRTIDSGDGATHDFDCDRDHPYVAMLVEPARLPYECDRLRDLLGAWGVEVRPQTLEESPCIQGSYDPADGTAVIDLSHVTDAMLGEADPETQLRAADALAARTKRLLDRMRAPYDYGVTAEPVRQRLAAYLRLRGQWPQPRCDEGDAGRADVASRRMSSHLGSHENEPERGAS